MAFLQLRDFDLDLVELTLGIFEGDTQPFSLLRCGDICLRSRIIGGRPISEDSCGSPCGKLASIRTPGVPLPAWSSVSVAGPLPRPHDPHLHEASHDQRWLPNTPGLIYEGQELIYLLAHNSRESARKNWAEFGEDPEWQHVARASRGRRQDRRKGRLHFHGPYRLLTDEVIGRGSVVDAGAVKNWDFLK
jgi:hypothetical protein